MLYKGDDYLGLLKYVVNIFEVIYKEAEKAWLNEGKYNEALHELYESLESGEITEEEYEVEEAELLEHLKAIREYKKEHEIEGD